VNTALGPAGAWWLKQRLQRRQASLLTGHAVRTAEVAGDRVRLRVERADGAVVDWTTDHLIAGTGYRVDLDRLPFLTDRLRASLRRVERAPLLSPAFESSAPGLYFVGLASAYSLGPMMRFVYGADYSARRLVGRLARNPGARVPARSRRAVTAGQ
jgi:FAD-dependent urate hydroxylase